MTNAGETALKVFAVAGKCKQCPAAHLSSKQQCARQQPHNSSISLRSTQTLGHARYSVVGLQTAKSPSLPEKSTIDLQLLSASHMSFTESRSSLKVW
eukprot:CAMPEP_0172851628 /NCGR_PEP_ID=MMETSP1075-20121228/51753_1 /TAXON_ID=2916 /ORGANISM="Ceratium fusus, Strain PA161109" /LENGTH=96 /DNA_ID=CAMNT_0013697681 /DNA_START=20 /DNA_END=310 /DNA_ORIENTATION=+